MNKIDPIIERFRFAHHNVAMLFAAGLTIAEISRRTGFTQRRLVILLDDPTFSELIEHYRKPYVEKTHQAIADAHEMMGFAQATSLRQIVERLEDADEGGDPVPLPHLIKIHAEMADRVGLSKHTVKTVLNVDFATALDRAIERSGKAPELKLIEESPIGLPKPKGYRRS